MTIFWEAPAHPQAVDVLPGRWPGTLARPLCARPRPRPHAHPPCSAHVWSCDSSATQSAFNAVVTRACPGPLFIQGDTWSKLRFVLPSIMVSQPRASQERGRIFPRHRSRASRQRPHPPGGRRRTRSQPVGERAAPSAQRPASGIGPLGSAPSRPRPHSALPTLNQGGAPGDIGVPCCGERGTGWACGWWRSHSWSPCRLGATGVPAWCPNTHSSPTPACAPAKRLGGPGGQVEFHGQCPETRGAWPRALQKPTGGRHRAAAPWKGPRRLAQLPALTPSQSPQHLSPRSLEQGSAAAAPLRPAALRPPHLPAHSAPSPPPPGTGRLPQPRKGNAASGCQAPCRKDTRDAEI